jgi:hypothetical protein
MQKHILKYKDDDIHYSNVFIALALSLSGRMRVVLRLECTIKDMLNPWVLGVDDRW